MFNSSAKVECIGFLLIPGFSMFSFSSLIEPLRTANHISGKTLYHWRIYSQNNEVVYASNGLPFMPNCLLTDTQDLDAAFIVAGP